MDGAGSGGSDMTGSVAGVAAGEDVRALVGHPGSRALRLAAITLLACATLIACDDNGAPKARFLSIATGGTGSIFYPYGGGIAKVLSEHLPATRATAEVTGASVDNLKFVRDGRADLALTLADTLADAVKGRGAFESSGPVPAATLAVLFPYYVQVVTLDSSTIRDIDDLKGKVVSTGSPGSGTEVVALRVLRAAGLDPSRDVRRQALGVAESAEALKDGRVDAFFWASGLPTPAIQDLSHTPGFAIRMIPNAHLLAALRRDFGDLYFELQVPRDAYPGIREPIPVVGSSSVLVVKQSMDEQLAYDITRLLFEHQPELAAIHPEARNLSLRTASAHSPAPFHTGAIRYYRERGAWRER